MKKITFSLLALMLSISAFASNITLKEAEAMALSDNIDLLSKQEELQASKYQLYNSYAAILPSASLTGGYTKPDEPVQIMPTQEYESTKSYGYNINQPLFAGGRIVLSALMQKDSYQIAKREYEQKKIEIVRTVREKYYSVLEAKNLFTLAEKNYQNAIVNEEKAKIKFESGIISKADYLQFQSETAQKEVNLIQAENLYKTGLADLQNTLNLEEEIEVIEISFEGDESFAEKLTTMTPAEIEKNLLILSNKAKKENISLANFKKTIAINKKSLLMSYGSALPNLSLSYQKNWSKTDLDNDYSNSGTLMLNASLPIFPLVDNGSNIMKSKHNLKQINYNYQSLQNTIDLNIKRTFYSLIAAAKSLKSAKLTEEYSHQTYLQMKARFDNNIISANDLLSIEIMWRNSQNQAVSAKYDFLIIKTQLLELLSTTDDTIIKNLK